jgi:hypothetical protein
MKNAKCKSQPYFSLHGYNGNLLPLILHFSLAQTWQARIGFRATDTSIFTKQDHMPESSRQGGQFAFFIGRLQKRDTNSKILRHEDG